MSFWHLIFYEEMGWTAKFQEQQCLNLDAQNQYINNIETTYGGNSHHGGSLLFGDI